jgi:diguanylate cyclase (GGDEF)-like protein
MDLDEKMSSAKRHKHDLSLMLIEISHFEDMMAINGRAKTHEYIKLFSQLISNTVRLEDNKYRLYEDMFAVILSHTDQEGAKHLEERMRNTFSVLRSEDKKKKGPVFGINTAVVQYTDKIRSSLDYRDIAIEYLGKNK